MGISPILTGKKNVRRLMVVANPFKELLLVKSLGKAAFRSLERTKLRSSID